MWIPIVPCGTDDAATGFDSSEPCKTTPGNVSSEEEEKKERAREYRRRYKQRQKEKELEQRQQVEQTQLELEKLRLEQDALISESKALYSLTSYSNSMVQALSSVASASAAKARSLGGQAMDGVNKLRGWTWQQWVMFPTIAELLAGTVWTPSEDNMRWYLSTPKTQQFLSMHVHFLDRIAAILEEGKKSPEAQKHAELRLNFSIGNWLRFITFMNKENPAALEELVCTLLLKSIREPAGEGKYVRPKMLQSGSDQLTTWVALDEEQRSKLDEYWNVFVRDITAARATLEKYTSKVADGMDATIKTGVYNPGSSKSAAENFLLAFDITNASDDFLLREGRAFIKLWISVINTLNLMQNAIIMTSCRPSLPHLPDICKLLLDTPSSKMEGHQGLPLTAGN